MTTFGLTAGAHYLKSFNIFRTKSGETKKNVEILQQHMPPVIQRMLPKRQQLNILSVGSAEGEKDMIILKIIKEELQKSDHGEQIKIFNRAIEPNEYSCGLYKAAIENLLSPLEDQRIEFEICQQTFQEYQKSMKEPVKFDIIHFIHSIYYMDVEQTLRYCFKKELSDGGVFVFMVQCPDLLYWILLKQRKHWHGEEVASETYETAEKLIQIANENGWKHEVYTQEYSIDVTEVFVPKSTEGNLLLDFLTHTVNFRETGDKRLVEETLSLIKDLTIVKDGKRLGEKKESLIVIYKK